MTQQEYIILYEKFCAGICTPEEKELLDQYSKEFLKDEPWLPSMGHEAEVEARITNVITNTINKLKVRRLFKRFAAAAVVLLSLGAAMFILKAPKEQMPMAVVKNKPTPYKILFRAVQKLY